jgi:hypothetical protein
MLQIQEFTEARMATLTTRIQKHGDEDVPAVSLGLVLTVANTLLDSIDPCIRESLFKRIDGQPDLPGVESSTPVLRCNTVDSTRLTTKYEGWTLEVDDGIDDTQPKTFSGCKVDKFVVEAKQGGSCVLSLRVGTSDLDAERSGLLAMHVGQSIWIKLRAPEKAQEEPVQQQQQGPTGTDDNDDDDSLFPPDDDDQQPDAPLTATDVFINGGEPPASTVPVTVKKSRRLTGKLGTDADQAARQAAVLSAADSKAVH